MIKAMFIAASYQQACYWANQWGYNKREIKYVPMLGEWHHNLVGMCKPEYPVYVCGTAKYDILHGELYDYLVDIIEVDEVFNAEINLQAM